MTSIYRYNFSEELVHKILCFSKMYQFEERKDYKEKWELWCEENNDCILKETERLTALGYEGDILIKMYKASRYYFRKKKLEKHIPKKREQYISISRELLEKMDTYITDNLKLEKKPKDMFIQFCELYSDFIQLSVDELNEKGYQDRSDIHLKIKKTFKNRYFSLTH